MFENRTSTAASPDQAKRFWSANNAVWDIIRVIMRCLGSDTGGKNVWMQREAVTDMVAAGNNKSDDGKPVASNHPSAQYDPRFPPPLGS